MNSSTPFSRSRAALGAGFLLAACAAAPAWASTGAATADAALATPALLAWSLPFIAILLAIAILPLTRHAAHWWERNRNKLLVSAVLGALVAAYYALRAPGFEGAPPGLASLNKMLHSALIADYFPFIVLLLSLFTISGGIRLTGDVPARPATNVLILFLGAMLASFIGTTGASMVLIRPLLQINSERKHVKHTVIFFIFLVSNIGGCLLPVGDPPLFLGYLAGVPFLWTWHLWPAWLTCTGALLGVYWVMDVVAYRHEDKESLRLDETRRQPIRLRGLRNLPLLAGVVLAVALLVPGRPLPGGAAVLPQYYLRELAQLALCGLSLAITPRHIRRENHFNFIAIGEVAALFVGIFITLQAPIELLRLLGGRLPLRSSAHFFWASGALSSFLDNAPTYVVFFEAARVVPVAAGTKMLELLGGQGAVPVHLLEAVSLGAVFMGANTYIGNGPNFLVKSIAEHHGIKMPSFFGYMLYSGLILIPLFILITFIFL